MTINKIKERNESKSKRNLFERDQEFSSFVEKIVAELHAYLPEQSRETANRCLDLCKRNEFVIMIAGEISVGKSSFLNALMGKSILLTDTTETTAAITYLKTGEGVPGVKKDHVKITYKDGGVEWIPFGDSERLKDVTTSLDGNQNAISRVKMAEVFCSKETLDIPQGVTIIDTPGLNGSDTHAELTHREMGLCHVALFLLDASKFGTLSNREEFSRLYRYAPQVLFVVNKWDLVRATCKSLLQMKDEYFEKLGNWASEGDVSGDNIYVVSGKEALAAQEKYAEILNNTPPEDWISVNRIKLLPNPDNEYFALETKMIEIMEDTQKKSLIRKRPLMTLSLLTRDCLDEYEKNAQKYLSVDAELEARINAETARVNQKRDDAERAFSEVRDFAKRIAEKETKAYREIVESAMEKLKKQVRDKIKRSDVNHLNSEEGLDGFTAYVQEQVEKLSSKPISERFIAFVTYIQNLLESNAKVNVGETVFSTSNDHLKNDIEDLNRERRSLERKMASASSERETLKLSIETAHSAIESCEREIARINERGEKYEKLDAQLKKIERQRSALGNRPTPETRYETETYYVKKSRGFFGSLWNGFKSLFGVEDDDYEERTREVPHTDLTKVHAWDKKHSAISAQIDAKRKERNSFKLDINALRIQEQEKLSQQKKLEKARKDLEKLEDDLKQHRLRMKNLGEESVRQLALEYWTNELNRISESMEFMVNGLTEEIERILKNFWRNRSRRVEKYLEDFGRREKQMQEDRRRNSVEYENLCKGIETLKKIRKELEIELNK